MKLHSPAKINLFLKVVGKYQNGYHELESLFAFLDLYDELEVEKSNNFSLEISGEFSSFISPKHNLFTKILDFFADNFSVSRNLAIKIKKNIPVGAGLGGGSSNAAYFMMELNKIFQLGLSKNELQKISLQFGADVPFFFEKQASLVRGIGEKITSFPNFTTIDAILINPKIHLLTKDVFANFDHSFAKKTSDEELLKQNIFDLIKIPNCLTKPAITMTPEVKIILDELKNSQAILAKMSGSGSTCFGIFSHTNDLDLAKKHFIQKFPNFFIKKVKILHHV